VFLLVGTSDIVKTDDGAERFREYLGIYGEAPLCCRFAERAVLPPDVP